MTSRYSRTLATLVAGLVLGATSTLAAGEDDGHGHGDDMPMADHHGDMAMVGMPGQDGEVTRTIEVTMNDFYYEPESIDAKAGETIRFVVTNNGEVVHEFNIGTAAMHAAHQDEMAMMVEHGVIEVDRINHDMMNMDMGNGHVMTHDDPNTVLLEPGQRAEVIWKFTEATPMEFACNVPGHYDAGMMGDITVTQ